MIIAMAKDIRVILVEEIEKDFGKDVTDLVDGVTKLSKLTFRTSEEKQAENFRKMIIAMAKDIRVILVKLADRLSNMRTLEHMPEIKQKVIAQETLDIYAPIANRLGISWMKVELEDLCLRYLHPEAYSRLSSLVAQTKKEREKHIDDICQLLIEKLKDYDVVATVEGRAKHFNSIYRKMERRSLDFEQIHDIIAFRILVDNITECYKALGVIHAAYKPVPGRFKDYIAMAKANGYQSLHTTVIGPSGKPVEIQIRTLEMHQVAEFGIAAHWKYKQGEKAGAKIEEKLAWIRQLIEWQKDITNPNEFIQNLKLDLFLNEVFAFTPKGDVFNLPLGATALDFAYLIHTEIGHRTTGIKINNQIMPLGTELKNGDIVEVLTAKKDQPSLDWLNFVITHQAKVKIKAWFRKLKTAENIALGQSTLEKALRAVGLNADEELKIEKITPVFKKFNFKTIEDLYRGIAYGDFSAQVIAEKIKKQHDEEAGVLPEIVKTAQDSINKNKVKTKPAKSDGVSVVGVDDILVRLAKCCTPLPGDEIIGIVTKGHGISVHRIQCHNVTNKKSDLQTTPVQWNKQTEGFFDVGLEVKAFDRVGLLKDILNAVAESRTNVREAQVKMGEEGGMMIAYLVLHIRDVEHLSSVINTIRRMNDVYDVYRVKN
jgi:GTP pyrophosphokinase